MSDAALEALWKNVVDRWDDEHTHGAFLEHCQNTDQLVEAAVRYRGMAGDRERGDAAQKRLQGVAILAMAKLGHDHDGDPMRLRLSDDAYASWKAFEREVEPRIGQDGDLRQICVGVRM